GKFPYVTAGNTKVLLNDQTTAVLDEFTSDNVAFHQGYLANRGLDESKLLLLRVSDNAMGDIAAEGDEVLIDQKETTVAKTDLFALVVNGRIWIRWIRPELDGSFSVASENQELYPSVSMPDLERVNIIGRVCRISKDR
ncbi:S24 family peptidase, partial [Endozoicomonas lisbonensis]